MVGKTSNSVSIDGFSANAAGYVTCTDTDFQPLIVNRKGTDGKTITIQNDGTERAFIGVTSGDNLEISATSGGGSGLQFWGAGYRPLITP